MLKGGYEYNGSVSVWVAGVRKGVVQSEREDELVDRSSGSIAREENEVLRCAPCDLGVDRLYKIEICSEYKYDSRRVLLEMKITLLVPRSCAPHRGSKSIGVP